MDGANERHGGAREGGTGGAGPGVRGGGKGEGTGGGERAGWGEGGEGERSCSHLTPPPTHPPNHPPNHPPTPPPPRGVRTRRLLQTCWLVSLPHFYSFSNSVSPTRHAGCCRRAGWWCRSRSTRPPPGRPKTVPSRHPPPPYTHTRAQAAPVARRAVTQAVKLVVKRTN